MLSDNGLSTPPDSPGGRGGRNRLETLLAELGIDQKHSRPNHPTTCGKVERFHQTLKKWLSTPDPTSHHRRPPNLLDEFVDEYNQRRPHASLGRATPAIAYTRLPKTGPPATTDYRLPDPTTTASTTTAESRLRYNSRPHDKIGIGRAHAGTAITMLIADLNIRIIATATGELLRHLDLDPTRGYQPTGNRKTPEPEVRGFPMSRDITMVADGGT